MNEFLIKRWPTALRVVLLAYGLTLAFGSKEGFPESVDYGFGMPFLSDRPVGEDAYYMLTVAWNVAESGSITYNYERRTTGIQPLSTFIYAAVAKVVQAFSGDKWSLLRAIIVLNVLLCVAFASKIGSIARAVMVDRATQDLAYAVGVVTSLSSMWVFRAFTYGLETGIYLLLLASTILLTMRPGRLDPIRFGVLGGVTGLARIDFGLIFGLQLLWLLKRRRLSPFGALGAGVLALAVTTPWFLWVHAVTGEWTPSSAGAQASWITMNAAGVDRLAWMVKALSFNFSPWVTSWDLDLQLRWALIALALFLSLTVPPARASLKVGAVVADGRTTRQLVAWFMCIATLIPVYVVAFWAKHFYGRYTAPLLVVTIPMLAILATFAGQRFKRLPLVVLGLSPATFVGLAIMQLHSGHMTLDFPINAGFVSKEIDRERRVGAFQSGVLGFFNENVVNLDGKIDPQALHSIRHGRLVDYVDSQGIDVLVDWPEFLEGTFLKSDDASRWQLCKLQPGGHSYCYERK